MRILILGAGGIGGYLGARLHEAGGEVTFLVRDGRKALLTEQGLKVRSPFGDLHIQVNLLTAGELKDHFDIVLLSSKSYDLDSAIKAIAPAMGDESLVIPFLNGFSHLERLDSVFGKHRVGGGVAQIAATMSPEGEIVHLNRSHSFTIGPRVLEQAEPILELGDLFKSARLESRVSENIEQEMWEKFVFISTLAGATCLMRADTGTILETDGGERLILGILEECEKTAAVNGHGIPQEKLIVYRDQLLKKNSRATSSMLRDIEQGKPTEGEHIIGDMLKRGRLGGLVMPFLEITNGHLQAYERMRARG
ncbi:MAG: ketopantoate reductase family protein [Leptospirillum sp.]|jgi:2-dehydropantoate 2-reductase